MDIWKNQDLSTNAFGNENIRLELSRVLIEADIYEGLLVTAGEMPTNGYRVAYQEDRDFLERGAVLHSSVQRMI